MTKVPLKDLHLKEYSTHLITYHKTVLVLEWLSVHSLLWIFHGTRTISDSWKYLTEEIADPASMPGKEKLYMVYVGFLDICQSSGCGLDGIVLVQVLISGLSVIFMYKILRLLNQSVIPAFFNPCPGRY